MKDGMGVVGVPFYIVRDISHLQVPASSTSLMAPFPIRQPETIG